MTTSLTVESPRAQKKPHGFAAGWIAFALLTACGIAFAQDSDQATIPLGDVPRQSRPQTASYASKSNRAQQLVDEMQEEQEASDNAPFGFRNYDAGEYRIFVPYPYSLEGRENGGAVLLGSRLGITNTEVLAGTPVQIPVHLAEQYRANFVRQVAAQYGATYCSPIQNAGHSAFRCAFQGTPSLLGHQVWGSMELIVDGDKVIPIMCVSPDDLRACVNSAAFGNRGCNNRYPSWQEMQRAKNEIQTRYRDELTTTQMCDQIIYPSIQLKSQIVVHPASISKAQAPKVAAGEIPEDTSLAAYGAPQIPVAQLARQTRDTPRVPPHAVLDNAEGTSPAPRGYKPFVLQHCQNPQQCAEASFVIPEKAEIISTINSQYIFKVPLGDAYVMLYAGPADVSAPYRSLTDADFRRMRDLANSNGWSSEKADDVSTQQMSIEGRPALMTRFRYHRDEKRWWIGERLLIQNQGAQFLVGCTALEEKFADVEVFCTTLVNSLRLP